MVSSYVCPELITDVCIVYSDFASWSVSVEEICSSAFYSPTVKMSFSKLAVFKRKVSTQN